MKPNVNLRSMTMGVGSSPSSGIVRHVAYTSIASEHCSDPANMRAHAHAAILPMLVPLLMLEMHTCFDHH